MLYADKDRSGDVFDLPLQSLCPNPFNRRKMKGVPELAGTIREVGLLQSIAHIRAEVWLKAYPHTADQITADNVILFGEHRWRAFQMLERPTIPSILSDNKVKDARLITLIENLRRAQLSALEEAEHYHALREEGLSYEQIAERIGETEKGAVSKGTVWKRVQLLELPPAVQAALADGSLRISAAEKLVKLPTVEDQLDAFTLIQDGAHPVEAQSRILARQRQAADADPSEAAQSPAETTSPQGVSSGNAGPESPASVSTGNATPPARRRSQDQDKAKPSADQYERDRATAAADRDAACQHLVATIDLQAAERNEMLIEVLTAALLAPPQQGPAQQRALVWLRKAGRQGLDETRAGAYFNAVQESADPQLQRLAAFASSLAAGELRTSARRQSWGAREIGHVRFLQRYAQYVPETEWEKKELGLLTAATAGGSR